MFELRVTRKDLECSGRTFVSLEQQKDMTWRKDRDREWDLIRSGFFPLPVFFLPLILVLIYFVLLYFSNKLFIHSTCKLM